MAWRRARSRMVVLRARPRSIRLSFEADIRAALPTAASVRSRSTLAALSSAPRSTRMRRARSVPRSTGRWRVDIVDHPKGLCTAAYRGRRLGRCSDRSLARRVRERPLIRRRFGVRATAPDAMARQFALVRGFRDRERTGVDRGGHRGRGRGRHRPCRGGRSTGLAGHDRGVRRLERGVRGPHVRARGRRPPPRRDPRARAVPLGRPGRSATLDRDRRSAAVHPVPCPRLARGPSGSRAGADLPRIELLLWIGFCNFTW